MTIAAELMEILACPQCKGSITVFGEEPFLVCSACWIKFPIIDGIPVMLVEESLKLDDD